MNEFNDEFNEIEEAEDTVDFDIDTEIDVSELEPLNTHASGKWDGVFDGSYDSSRYSDQTLETDIVNAGRGIYANSLGELVKESSDRLDVWGIGEEGDYNHWYYNGITNEWGKAPDGRHNTN